MSKVLKFAGYCIAGVFLLATLASVIGATTELVSFHNDKKKFPPPGKLVDVGGLTLHLDCRGQGGPIILIDGGAGNWSTHWAHIQDKLIKVSRVCLHDRPGFGWSDSIKERMTGREYAEQLHQLMRTAGEEPPYLFVGHSLGAYIGRIYQNLYPNEIAGILLVDPGHEDQFDKMPYLKASLDGIDASFSTAAFMARFGLFRIFGAPQVFAPVPDEDRQEMIDAATKTPRFWNAMALTFSSGLWIADELKGKGAVGDTPVQILSAGQSAKNYCVALGFDCMQTQRDWDALQASLLSISTKSEQAIHPTSSHDMHVDDPGFIIDNIETMRTKLVEQD